MVLKVVLRLVPTRLNAAIAATAINAAINPYSIAVTPDSSLMTLVKNIGEPNLFVWGKQRAQIARTLRRALTTRTREFVSELRGYWRWC